MRLEAKLIHLAPDTVFAREALVAITGTEVRLNDDVAGKVIAAWQVNDWVMVTVDVPGNRADFGDPWWGPEPGYQRG